MHCVKEGLLASQHLQSGKVFGKAQHQLRNNLHADKAEGVDIVGVVLACRQTNGACAVALSELNAVHRKVKHMYASYMCMGMLSGTW